VGAVGGALLSAAEAWARDRGAEIVRLDTYPESPVSVPFTSAWVTFGAPSSSRSTCPMGSLERRSSRRLRKLPVGVRADLLRVLASPARVRADVILKGIQTADRPRGLLLLVEVTTRRIWMCGSADRLGCSGRPELRRTDLGTDHRVAAPSMLVRTSNPKW
jgi:hypothetical protein